jgi:AraC family transcriptional regulator, melibiose operon regulatory protein
LKYCKSILNSALFFLYPKMDSLKNSEINTFGLRVWDGVVDSSYPPHRHNEIELNIIQQGFLTYTLAGRVSTVNEGELALFWGAIPHQVIDYQPATHVHWGTVPLDYVLRWELPRPFLLALLSGRMFQTTQSLYHLQFFSQWQADLLEGQETVVLLEIKALFFRFAQSGQTRVEMVNDRANQMARYMSENFQESLSVAQIAGEIGVHPNYAMTLFKEAFGLSLIDYLTQQRIAHAQQQLILTNESITQIALDSGFQTLSHFYSAFQRLCGMSPGKYRASLRS